MAILRVADTLNLDECEERLFWLLGLKNNVQCINMSNASVSTRGLKTCEILIVGQSDY